MDFGNNELFSLYFNSQIWQLVPSHPTRILGTKWSAFYRCIIYPKLSQLLYLYDLFLSFINLNMKSVLITFTTCCSHSMCKMYENLFDYPRLWCTGIFQFFMKSKCSTLVGRTTTMIFGMYAYYSYPGIPSQDLLAMACHLIRSQASAELTNTDIHVDSLWIKKYIYIEGTIKRLQPGC